MTEERRAEIENACLGADSLVLPVDDVRDLLAASRPRRSYEQLDRRLQQLEGARDDASPKDESLLDLESL